MTRWTGTSRRRSWPEVAEPRANTPTEHAYPEDLARFVLERVVAMGASCNLATLARVVSVAYQASLLREEERALSFRLLLLPPERLALEAGPPHGCQRLRFDEPRAFDEQEIRRLAPAVKMQRAMIGVFGSTPLDLRMWGLVQTGPGWLHAIQGGRSIGTPLPKALSIVAAGPGRITVSLGDVTIAKLAGGSIAGRSLDVFDSMWLPDACAENRRDVMALHERNSSGAAVDAGLLRRVDQQLVRRIIANVRLSRHGGTIVILPQKESERVALTGAPIRLKYRFANEEARRRYRALQLALLPALVADAERNGQPLTWETYLASKSPECVAIDDALLELAHTIADFADVDGAVVMNRRMEVIGFGGEIVGELPDVPRVMHALDPEGLEREEETTDRVGTRHRSVYRLCSAVPEAVAIVVSQDGGVRLVAHKDGRVTYWDQLGTGPMEI